MKISALIPTYNRRKKVFRAIDSVLAQTVPVDEIIVVDDGSTDGTAEAIRDRYANRVALFTQANAGVAAARNRGLREARGEWIAFLDSDDVWLPTKIERQLDVLSKLGDGFGFCFTDCIYEGNLELKMPVFEERGFVPGVKFGPLEDPTRYLADRRDICWTPSLLVRRSLLEDLGGFDQDLAVAEDTDLVFRLSFKTKFCFVAEPLVGIDRAASRDGLCNLFTTRADAKYGSHERLYNKWLAMPGIAGSRYEQPIREHLRETYYNSTEAKLHDLRIRAALKKMGRLHASGESYVSIIGTLASRKIGKIRQRLADSSTAIILGVPRPKPAR